VAALDFPQDPLGHDEAFLLEEDCRHHIVPHLAGPTVRRVGRR
jgi:hypothetical protein